MLSRTRLIPIVGAAILAACGAQPEHDPRAPETPAVEEQAADEHVGHEEPGAAAAPTTADPHAGHAAPAVTTPATTEAHARHTMSAAAPASTADPHAGHAAPAATTPTDDASGLLALVVALLADPEVRSIVAEDPQLRGYLGEIEPAPTAPADSGAVVAVVQQFHSALAAGDSLAALALLAEDAVILEGGALETRAEYRAHHLPADIAFARAVTTERGPTHVKIDGDVAWASSTATTTGRFRDRDINTADAELMVLTRGPQGWRIAAIHWSSRSRRS